MVIRSLVHKFQENRSNLRHSIKHCRRSTTWIAAELLSNLLSNAHRKVGVCWRSAEAQHINSTMKLVDNSEEQDRLEQLLRSVGGKRRSAVSA